MTDEELIPRPAEVRRQLELARKRVEALTAQLKVSVRHHGDDGPKPAGPAADAWAVELPVATTLPVPKTSSIPEESKVPDVARPQHPKRDHPEPRR